MRRPLPWPSSRRPVRWSARSVAPALTRHSGLLAHDGRQRTYLVHDFGRGGPAPVVIVLHGGGGNAANAVRMTSFDHVAGHSTRRRRCGHSSGISVAHAETIAVSHARE